ncbi:MAG TPA: methyl-accepting chemotaxis protein [Vicinamibacterales bacterium]
MTIGTKLYGAGGALGGLVVALGVASWWAGAAIQGRFEETSTGTVHRLSLAYELQAQVEGATRAERSAMLAAMASDTAELASQQAQLANYLTKASANVETLAPQMRLDTGRKAVQDLQAQFRTLSEVQREVDQLIEAGQMAEAYALSQSKGQPVRQAIVRNVETVLTQERQFLERDINDGRQAFTWIRAAITALTVLAGLVAVAFVQLVRGICRTLTTTAAELGDGAHHVAAAATQVASSSQGLAQGASEQAASLEETSASMEELAAMTRQNAQNSQQAAALMADVDAQVRSSNEALADMVASMASIQESSTKVSKIIRTIDEIAFQTNILALNAAVEAARAGEAGMGFAVVADEVRSLAQRSAQAARDTATLIEESAAKAEQGGTKVNQVASSIAAITEGVSRVKGLVEEVSVASRQQAQGIDQVTQAVSQMEKVTQGTAATAEESAAASEELSAQAAATLQAVARLEAMVGRQRSADTTGAAPAAAPSSGGKVVTISPARKPSTGRSAEEILPLEDSGTFGRF